MSATMAGVSDNTAESIPAESPNVQLRKQFLENLESNVDAPELAMLLQCIGFSLQSFEKIDVENQIQSDVAERHIQIHITCMKSRMKATLLKEKTGCKCPSAEDASNAQFWNISGCSPSLPGNVTVSKSSLIPTVPASKSKLVNILLLKALDIIHSNEISKNTENFHDLFKNTSFGRHRSLENLRSESFYNVSRSSLKEGRNSSPKQTSSPIPELSNSLKQGALDSEKATQLIETLRTAQKFLSDAVDLAHNQNATFIKRVRRISDIKISPLATEDQKFTNTIEVMDMSRKDNSRCKATPKKPMASKIVSTTGEKKKFLMPPSKLGLLRMRKSDTGTPATSKLLANKTKDGPKTSASKEKNLKLNLSAAKAKAATRNDTPLNKLRIPSKIASFSGIKKSK